MHVFRLFAFQITVPLKPYQKTVGSVSKESYQRVMNKVNSPSRNIQKPICFETKLASESYDEEIPAHRSLYYFIKIRFNFTVKDIWYKGDIVKEDYERK